MTWAERTAETTWNLLRQSRRHQVRLGEETITDLLVLDFAAHAPSQYVRLFHSTKLQEADQGTDLELRVRAGGTHAHVFAIQAKKLGRKDRYDSLNSRVGTTSDYQIDRLEEYARHAPAIPLYLLYNCADDKKIMSFGNCCQAVSREQLGCTLVHSCRIREAISTRGRRTFDAIHSQGGTLTHSSCEPFPWRCIFDCPHGLSYVVTKAAKPLQRQQPPSSPEFQATPDAWPHWLWERTGDPMLSPDDLMRLIRTGPDEQAASIDDVAPREEPARPEVSIESHENSAARETGVRPSGFTGFPRRLLLVDPEGNRPLPQ